jgi:PAS domain-containing protein
MTKRMEMEIAASEMRYRRLFEAAKDGIIILDATSGQVQVVKALLAVA